MAEVTSGSAWKRVAAVQRFALTALFYAQFSVERLEELRRLIHREQQSAKQSTVPTAFVTFKCAAWHRSGKLSAYSGDRACDGCQKLRNMLLTACDCQKGAAQQLNLMYEASCADAPEW